MVHEEGCEEGHGGEEHQDAETQDPLPVGLVDAPDLACVPHHEVGSLAVLGAPGPDETRSQQEKHSLVEP